MNFERTQFTTQDSISQFGTNHLHMGLPETMLNNTVQQLYLKHTPNEWKTCSFASGNSRQKGSTWISSLDLISSLQEIQQRKEHINWSRRKQTSPECGIVCETSELFFFLKINVMGDKTSRETDLKRLKENWPNTIYNLYQIMKLKSIYTWFFFLQ